MVKNYKQFLLEKSFYDITENDIFTPDYIKYLSNSDEFKDIVYVYREIFKISDNIKDSEIIKTQKYKNWFLEVYMDKYYDVIEKLDKNIENNKVIIYRGMIVKKNWIEHLNKEGKHLGIYWTFDFDSAIAHWGSYTQGQFIKLQAEIDEKYINWNETIRMNLLLDEENEIRLFKNTPIIINHIYNEDNQEIDISPIKNKIFKA